jgi:hypothetical protein
MHNNAHRQHTALAANGGWLNMPAAILSESGVILLREPPDADTDALTTSLCTGGSIRNRSWSTMA